MGKVHYMIILLLYDCYIIIGLSIIILSFTIALEGVLAFSDIVSVYVEYVDMCVTHIFVICFI